MVLVSDCDRNRAEEVRLTLQHAIEVVPFQANTGETIELTISSGTAMFPGDGDCCEALIAIADGRMYQDKIQKKKTRSTTATSDGNGSLNRRQDEADRRVRQD